MYAIIESGGKQYWVKPGETLRVDRLEAEKGSKVELKALWAASEEAGKEPVVSKKAKVTAQVVRQLRGPKLIVFKKKPKSRYRRTRGHRQDLTELKIQEIVLN